MKRPHTQQSLKNEDLKYIWHPCSQLSQYLSDELPLIPIKSAKGIYLYDFENNKYIDCISSWWVNIFGHSNEYINNALIMQVKELEHVLLAGFTHPQIIKLSRRLIGLLDSNFSKTNLQEFKLSKCFYADNGSSAVEIALKMSFHKNFLKSGQVRNTFLKLGNSYHGETLGALSMCDVGIYEEIYRPLLLESRILNLDENYVKNLKDILDKNYSKISAFILEPLLQCAGGMKIIKKEVVKEICEIVRGYEIDIIFDEIATGFGRTGEMFALHECEFIPDFLCLSKGITGGYLPLSVVITKDTIYNEFLGDRGRAFLHSHSYTGNALACACANAVLDIFENENVIEKNRFKSQFILEEWNGLNEFKCVKNIRGKGMVFAFEIEKINPIDFFNLALKHSLLLRPLGNTIYFMPPYIISESEIRFVVKNITEVLMILESKVH